MKISNVTMLIITSVAIIMTGCGPSSKLTTVEKQTVIRDMESETLQKLYAQQPSTRTEIQNAVGYGVFSNANVNLFVISGGGGYGVVVNNATGQKTYMHMALGGVGLGLGVKDYRQVLIFHSKKTMDNFVNKGWEFSANADAAAKASESGGELSGEGMIGDITVYSLTESGLALQATVAGTKYWKYDELN